LVDGVVVFEEGRKPKANQNAARGLLRAPRAKQTNSSPDDSPHIHIATSIEFFVYRFSGLPALLGFKPSTV